MTEASSSPRRARPSGAPSRDRCGTCARTTSPRASCGRRWTKVRRLDPADIDDLMLGCGLPGGEAGFNMGRVVAVLLGYDHLPGTTLTRCCASSLQTTRMAMHAIGPARARRSSPPASKRSAGTPRAAATRCPTRPTASSTKRGRAPMRPPPVARLPGTTPVKTASCRTPTSRWADRGERRVGA